MLLFTSGKNSKKHLFSFILTHLEPQIQFLLLQTLRATLAKRHYDHLESLLFQMLTFLYSSIKFECHTALGFLFFFLGRILHQFFTIYKFFVCLPYQTYLKNRGWVRVLPASWVIVSSLKALCTSGLFIVTVAVLPYLSVLTINFVHNLHPKYSKLVIFNWFIQCWRYSQCNYISSIDRINNSIIP